MRITNLLASISQVPEAQAKLRGLTIETLECKTDKHLVCPGSINPDGSFKVRDASLNQVLDALFGSSILQCKCACHSVLNANQTATK